MDSEIGPTFVIRSMLFSPVTQVQTYRNFSFTPDSQLRYPPIIINKALTDKLLFDIQSISIKLITNGVPKLTNE